MVAMFCFVKDKQLRFQQVLVAIAVLLISFSLKSLDSFKHNILRAYYPLG